MLGRFKRKHHMLPIAEGYDTGKMPPTIKIRKVEGGYIMQTYDMDDTGYHEDEIIFTKIEEALAFASGFMEGNPE